MMIKLNVCKSNIHIWDKYKAHQKDQRLGCLGQRCVDRHKAVGMKVQILYHMLMFIFVKTFTTEWTLGNQVGKWLAHLLLAKLQHWPSQNWHTCEWGIVVAERWSLQMGLMVWVPIYCGLFSSCHIWMPKLSATEMNTKPLLWHCSSCCLTDHLVQECPQASVICRSYHMLPHPKLATILSLFRPRRTRGHLRRDRYLFRVMVCLCGEQSQHHYPGY